MWDSSGGKPRKRSGEAKEGSPSADGPGVSSQVAPVQATVASGHLTLVPDPSLLTSPQAAFPIYIDPVWSTAQASSWAMVTSGHPNRTYFNFNGTEGVGLCDASQDPACGRNQVKRLFFQIPLPSLSGGRIESAEFIAYETSAHECDSDREVQLWRTSALSPTATWNNTVGAWKEHLASRSVSYCSRTPVEFGGDKLRTAVQNAVDAGDSSITFGLRAANERSMSWWKRFADDAYLRIRYNTPPAQPDTDTMFSSPGTQCTTGDGVEWVNKKPKLQAYLSDPDGDQVQGQFQISWADEPDGSDWGPKWTSPLTAAKSSGSMFEVDLNALDAPLPTKKYLAWHVRAWDGAQWGPWSHEAGRPDCGFYYDPSVPAAPTVASSDYPADGGWHGGVGEAGEFRISDASGTAARYEIRLNSEPARTVTTVDGAARDVLITPTRSGPNMLTVTAVSRAGSSTPTTVQFFVKSGVGPTARFTLDESAGATSVTAVGPGRAALVRGAAVLGEPGKIGTALALNGGHAESRLPAVRTDQSFTVSVWAKASEFGTRDVLAQDGVHQSGFRLGVEPDGTPVFKAPGRDSEGDGGGPWWQARGTAPLASDTWAHLVGVYDRPARRLRLYVNGSLAATADDVTLWRANGSLQIGRSKHNGVQTNSWRGAVDDIRIYQRALSDADVQNLFDGQTPSGDGPVAHWNLDEAQGANRVHSQAVPLTAALTGGATLGVPGQDGTALRLDGSGHAATDGPVIDPSRNYTIAAWVRPEAADGHQTVIAQEGARIGAFRLERAPDGTWKMVGRHSDEADDEGVSTASSTGPAQNGEWAHLVGVYDESSHRLSLYVNGEHQQTVTYSADAWRNAAHGPLTIGRWKDARHGGGPIDLFKGDIDDVRIWDRVLTAQEIAELIPQTSVLKTRWKLNTDGSGEPSGAPSLTLHGGATISPDAGFYWISSGGLLLNGTDAYASTESPPMDTDRSFTLAGWVRNPGRLRQPAVVFSQPGANANVLELRYLPDADNPEGSGDWQLIMRNADSATEPVRQVTHSMFSVGDWDHIAIVYDALRDRMSLYVNGMLEETSQNVSRTDGVIPFKAANAGLQLGRDPFGGAGGGSFWPDAIDDVWVCQGALTEQQVGFLAAPWEPSTESGPCSIGG